MKKLLIGLGLFVVAVVVAAVVIPFLVPLETYKEELQAQVRDATGRDLEIGDIGLSVFPTLSLRAEDVRFSNPPGAGEPQMASVSKLELALDVIPLLSGKLSIDHFVLVDPVIHLEVDDQGQANWNLAQGDSSTGSTPTTESATGQSGPALGDLHLGDVRLVNGRLTYRDAAERSYEISEVNMKLALPGLGSPLEALGSAKWNGETVELTLNADSLRDLMQGEETKITADVAAAPVRFGFDGAVTQGTVPQVRGSLDLNVPSVRDLAAWTGNPLEMPGTGLGPLQIKGELSLEGSRVSFTNSEVGIDSISGTGDVHFDGSRARPAIKAALQLGMLDLNPYIGEPKSKEQPAAPAGGREPGDWSDEPIDVSALSLVDADLSLRVDGLKFNEIELGKTSLAVILKNGDLTADLAEMNLYDGTGSGKVVVRGSQQVPTITAEFGLSEVQAEPLLTDASGFDRLLGRLNGDLSVTTEGSTQRQFVSNLDGGGAVTFLDGAIRGFNLASMIRNASTSAVRKGFDDAQSTDFAELSGTFDIKDGVVTNNDLKLLAPLLRASGKGEIPLPPRTLDYRLETKLTASIEGQGSNNDTSGLIIPVRFSGPWHKVTYAPDLEGLLKRGIGSPDQLLEDVKTLTKGGTEGEGVKDSLENVLDQLAPSTDATSGENEGVETDGGEKKKKVKPKDLLKGLFGND